MLSDASIVEAFPREPWPHQMQGIKELMLKLKHKDSVVLCSPTGCHAAGHPILMYDGTVKAAEDVEVGDLVMGHDSTPREVMALCRGSEEMYKITPLRGARPFVVNAGHVLSLRNARETKEGLEYSTMNISVREYLGKSKTFKHLSKLEHCEVASFGAPQQELPIGPYQLGVLLGDGTIGRGSVRVDKPDKEVHEAMAELAEQYGARYEMRLKRGTYQTGVLTIGRSGRGKNPVRVELDKLGLRVHSGDKFVPQAYKVASRENRLQMLAGLMDTDGSLKKAGYDFISKSRQLSEDVCFLARSVGLRAHIAPAEKYSQLGSGGIYWRVSISGDCSIVPCRIPRKMSPGRMQIKNHMVSGFSIESVGEGDFYGFTLDGDRMYLDGQFMRHHNSGKGLIQSALTNILASRGHGVMIYNVRRSLTDQTIDRFESENAHFGVRSAAHKHLQNLNALVQVGSLQTDVARILRQGVWEPHPCKLVLIDEAHLAMGPEYVKLMQMYLARGAKIVGITGTPVGMSSVYKDIVVAGKNSEMRACKAHVHAEVYAPHEMDISKIKPVKTGEYKDGDIIKHCWSQAIIGFIYDDYRRLNPDGKLTMATAPGIAESIWLANEFLAKGHRTLHIDYKEVVVNGVRYKNDAEGKVRQQALEDFKKGEFDILCNCETIQQGVDIPPLAHLILARPYGSLANAIQTMGRVIRWSPETPERVIVQDHGGVTYQHGLPDDDRDWEKHFYQSEKEIREEKKKEFQQDKVEQPIVCARCSMVRMGGAVCPGCGLASDKAVRVIVQQNGELKRVTGRIHPKAKEKPTLSVEQKRWDALFFGSRNSKSKNALNFRQARAIYERDYGEPPPDNLKRMPRNKLDELRRIREVEWRDLT